MSSKVKEEQGLIFDQLLDQLIDRIDSETGCVRSVYDHGIEYNIYQAVDHDMVWYLAITDDGMAIGFGLSYELVLKQAESYVFTLREQGDESSNDQQYDGTTEKDLHTLN